jgi:hypothetical protein
MPAWIHDRADHIRRKNPGMPKSESFAIATQQAHATGHTPQGYGTSEGKREAKEKYDSPKSEYKQTADPSHKTKTSANLALWKGFTDELQKISAVGGSAMTKLKTAPPKMAPSYAKAGVAPLESATKADVTMSTKALPPPAITAA